MTSNFAGSIKIGSLEGSVPVRYVRRYREAFLMAQGTGAPHAVSTRDRDGSTTEHDQKGLPMRPAAIRNYTVSHSVKEQGLDTGAAEEPVRQKPRSGRVRGERGDLPVLLHRRRSGRRWGANQRTSLIEERRLYWGAREENQTDLPRVGLYALGAGSGSSASTSETSSRIRWRESSSACCPQGVIS